MEKSASCALERRRWVTSILPLHHESLFTFRSEVPIKLLHLNLENSIEAIIKVTSIFCVLEVINLWIDFIRIAAGVVVHF
jgi:hypothetical protein